MVRGDYGPGTALVVIDVQNDFAHPDGALYVDGGETIIGGINDEIATASAAGRLVVYTQDWHPPRTPHFDEDGGAWPVHCVQDTWGARLHDDLDVVGPIVKKGTEGGDGYSGFSVRDPESGDETSTRLGAILEEHGVEQLYVAGLAKDVCVKETVLDARDRGYRTTLLSSLTRPVDPELASDTLEELTTAGATIR